MSTPFCVRAGGEQEGLPGKKPGDSRLIVNEAVGPRGLSQCLPALMNGDDTS